MESVLPRSDLSLTPPLAAAVSTRVLRSPVHSYFGGLPTDCCPTLPRAAAAPSSDTRKTCRRWPVAWIDAVAGTYSCHCGGRQILSGRADALLPRPRAVW